MKNKYDETQIDQYILGLLSPAEQSLFEQYMAEDKTFARQVIEQQKLANSIDDYGRQQFKKEVEKVEEALDRAGFFLPENEKGILNDLELVGKQDDFLDTLKDVEQSLEKEAFFEQQTATVVPLPSQDKKSSKTERKIGLWRRPLAIAASILLLVATVFLFTQQEELTREQLAENHALLDLKENTGIKGGNENPVEATYLAWEQAVAQYKAGDIRNSLRFFQTTNIDLIKEEDRAAFQFNRAVLETVNGNYQTADTIYESIANSNPGEVAYQRAVLKIYQKAPKAELVAAFSAIANASSTSGKLKQKAAAVLLELEQLEE